MTPQFFRKSGPQNVSIIDRRIPPLAHAVLLLAARQSFRQHLPMTATSHTPSYELNQLQQRSP